MNKKRKVSMNAFLPVLWILILSVTSCMQETGLSNPDQKPDVTVQSDYSIVGTGQDNFFGNQNEITKPVSGDAFFGQNAQYPGNEPQYQTNGDGTVTDLVSGLMWLQSPDLNGDGKIDVQDKRTYQEALDGATSLTSGGYNDWRLPTIKEQYSLILFSGIDPSGFEGSSTDDLVPFINTDYFNFGYGDTDAGERIIDAQFASSTRYTDYTMNGDETLFGVNLADGRIKGYGLQLFGKEKTFYVMYVRGNEAYGVNNFVDNEDGTISDKATGLMWMASDSGQGMNWQEALDYAENFEYRGYSDWRLPDAKELQSIVDYSQSPGYTQSPAIDPLFECTQISNEAGQIDFPAYWTSTTHENWTQNNGASAVYINFGRSMGYMMNQWIDVHGAGAQRSDPKAGNPADYPTGRGPQGDAIRINNYVRLVRNLN